MSEWLRSFESEVSSLGDTAAFELGGAPSYLTFSSDQSKLYGLGSMTKHDRTQANRGHFLSLIKTL